MKVRVEPVTTSAELRRFVKFPLKLYKGCPYYVPNLYMDELTALDPDKNPMGRYSKSCKFLAYNEKGEVVGRVMAIINEIANRDWKHQEVRFGWMDFVDDKDVSKALMDAVIDFGRSNGMTSLAGPLGFTDFDNEGCVVEGFDDISSFMLKYNYPYYGEHFEAMGMEKINDWLEYRIYVPDAVPDKVSRAANLISERYGLHVVKVSKKQIKKQDYGRKIFDLINRTYCSLFDFTVMPDDVVDQYIKTYLGLLDLRSVTLVEDNEGKLIALAISMPSLAHAVQKGGGYIFPFGWYHLLKSMYFKHEDALELMLIAVDPEYQNRGVHAMLFNELIPNLIKGGFKYGESNAEMETNTKVQNIWNLYRKEFKRRRRVFGKQI